MLYGRTRDGVTFYRRERSKDTSSDRDGGRAADQEFSILPADVVHREVASVSKGLLAAARFSDHVAVLTGRYAAEHLKVAALRPAATDRN